MVNSFLAKSYINYYRVVTISSLLFKVVFVIHTTVVTVLDHVINHF